MSTPSDDIALIWAQARDRIIGADGVMPWHLPEDLEHFRELTSGGVVVMGRRTWESIPSRFRPLPGRENIVVTRQERWSTEGALIAHSLDDALALGRSTQSVRNPMWIIGGGTLYAQARSVAHRAEITEIDLTVAGDTRAPILDESWTANPGEWLSSPSTVLRYRFVSYTKRFRQAG